jgi:hypothetical protein
VARLVTWKCVVVQANPLLLTMPAASLRATLPVLMDVLGSEVAVAAMERGSPLLGVGTSQLTGALTELVRAFGAEGAVAAVEQNMQVRHQMFDRGAASRRGCVWANRR